MKNLKLLTITSYTYFFLVGYFMNIGGSISNSLAKDLSVGTAIIGYSFSAFMIGRAIGIFGNGILLKKTFVDKNLYIRVVSGISLMSAIGLYVLPRGIATFAICIFFAGISIGGMYSIANMILVETYEGKEKTFHIAMINFLYSIGGVLSPFLAGLLIQNNFLWKHSYFLYGLVILSVLVITAAANYKGLYAEKHEMQKDTGRITGSLWMICGAIVCYILAEYSITYWTPIYMREAMGKDALFAGTCVSIFWIAVLIGRLSSGILIRWIRIRSYIIVSGALAVIALLSLRFTSSDASLLISSFFIGLFCAAMFPLLFSFGTDNSESIKRTFPTLMMLSAAAGSFLAMPIGSTVKKIAGIKEVVFIPIVTIFLACVFIAGVREKRVK